MSHTPGDLRMISGILGAAGSTLRAIADAWESGENSDDDVALRVHVLANVLLDTIKHQLLPGVPPRQESPAAMLKRVQDTVIARGLEGRYTGLRLVSPDASPGLLPAQEAPEDHPKPRKRPLTRREAELALYNHRGSISAAARSLDVARSTFREALHRREPEDG